MEASDGRSVEARTPIQVVVVPDPASAGQLAPGRSWEALEDRIGEIGTSVGAIATQLRERLEATLDDPAVEALWRIDTVTLAFSLDLAAEAGVIVARAKTTAGFEVSITWSRP